MFARGSTEAGPAPSGRTVPIDCAREPTGGGERDRPEDDRVLPRGGLRARRTTASASATSCASAGTGSCSSWRSRSPGPWRPRGSRRRLMRLAPPPEEPEEPGQFWKDFIRDTAPVFRKPTIEQLAGVPAAHLAGARSTAPMYVERPPGRDLRRARARRDRRGQRGGLRRRSPRAAARGRASCRATRSR